MILHTKKRFFRRAFFAFLIIGATVLAALNLIKTTDEKTSAISQTGQEVTIYFDPDEKIYYGEHPDTPGWDDEGNPYRGTTHHFWVRPTSGIQYMSYCANPSKKPLGGKYNVLRLDEGDMDNREEDYQLMKMAIFAGTGGGVNPSAAVANEANALLGRIFAGTNIPSGDKQYAYIHAILGAIYANDYAGLWGHTALVNNMIARLRSEKTNNTTAYIMAQSYGLFLVDRENPVEYPSGYGPGNYVADEFQDIVWIESAEYGGIDVKKKDIDTRGDPQGNASFYGLPFEVRAAERIFNPDTGAIYEVGAVVASGSTNASGEVSFRGLPLGKYNVVEVNGNASYNATAGPQTATVYYDGYNVTKTFYNTPKKGSIEVKKVDKETGSCSALGSAKIAGATFRVINRSSRAIVYRGSTISVGSEVTRGTVPTGQCSFTFADLPYGTYEVSEVNPGTGYLTNLTPQTIAIPNANNNYSIVITMPNQVKRGDMTFTKKNSRNNTVMGNVVFELRSKTTGEHHILVTNANGVIDTRSSFAAHTNHTNGYDNMSFIDVVGADHNITFQGYGTWFGNTAPDNSLGALPYDDYEIWEVTCPTNKWCYNLSSQKKEFTISDNNQLVTLGTNGTWYNECITPGISTTAVDNADNDKWVVAGSNTQIKDTITYTLLPNLTYTIKGTLMDKATNQAITTKTMTYTPTTETGSFNMVFDINTSSLGGHNVVVYEEVFYNDQLVTDHKNINDEGQTVTVVSLSTTAVDKADNDKFIVAGSNTTVKDTIHYCLRSGYTFTITGVLMDKATGQPIMNGSSQIVSSTTVTPSASNPCGDVTVEFNVNTSALAGKDIVVYESAYYGNALVVAHTDINDANQTVTVVSLNTAASDKADGDKWIVAGDVTTVRDTVSYCLRKGSTFTINGTLMDKATGQPVRNGGQAITASKTITPTSNCGTTTLDFELDTTDLAGHELVVYEEARYNNALVVDHKNINDENQTVVVVSLSTTAVDKFDSDKFIVAGSNTTVRDTVTYCLRKNYTFTIAGQLVNKETGDVVATNSTSLTPSEACGTLTMDFNVDTSAMAGADLVVFETVRYNNGLVIEHADLNDMDQTVTVVSLSTYAVDDEDDNKFIVSGSDTVVKDTISYCLRKDTTFAINGVLMDKVTRQSVKDSHGRPIVNSVTITPDTNCGTVEMTFEVDTSDLAGHDLVVYQEAFYNASFVVDHKEFDDEDQTVTVVSLATTATDKADGDQLILADHDAVITDEVRYCLRKGYAFRIEATLMDKQTGELIKNERGEDITVSKTITPTEACGTTYIDIPVDTKLLAGHDIVVYEAAYFGDILAVDHKDIDDLEQTVTVIDVWTVATDIEDDDEYVLPSTETNLRDTVGYCLKEGMTFKLIGYPVRKDDQSEFEDMDGYMVERTMKLNNLEERCGYVTMNFTIDTTDLVGKDVVVFEDVYLGDTLLIKHRDVYDEAQTVSVISLSTSAVDNEDGDKMIVPGEDTEIKDTVTYCLRAGRTYDITAALMDRATGEPLTKTVLNTDTGEEREVPITKTITHTVENDNCGTVDVVIPVNTANLAGHDIVVFETVEENSHTVITHEDLEDKEQTVTVVSLTTTATDDEDGDKYVFAGKEAVVRDEVHYCLMAGATFTIEGTLMNKETGEPITKTIIDEDTGEEIEVPVTASVEITPEDNCGTVDLTFPVDTSELGGKDIVVFEKAYQDDRLIISHEDIDDEEQTVRVVFLSTYAVYYEDETKMAELKINEVRKLTIKDTVTYCLVKGKKFTFKGVLVNKATGNNILVDGYPVERTVEFKPEDDCGEFDVFYEVSSKDLEDIASVVIFEDVYDENGDLIISFHDVNNEDETVHKTPKTGSAATKDIITESHENNTIFVVATLGVLIVATGVIVRGFARAIIKK